MTSKQAIGWFKKNFSQELDEAVTGRLYSANLLIAISYQETGYLWQKVIADPDQIATDAQRAAVLEVCVGDTIDAPERKAFPRNKQQLLKAPKGEAMFAIARAALEKVAALDPGYKEAVKHPDKFCHGYGVFQYDLQFFEEDAGFFLKKKWTDLAECLTRFIKELDGKMKKTFPKEKELLSHDNQVYLAIAYNQGHVDVGGGFAQGHKEKGGPFYGQNIDKYLALAEKL